MAVYVVVEWTNVVPTGLGTMLCPVISTPVNHCVDNLVTG